MLLGPADKAELYQGMAFYDGEMESKLIALKEECEERERVAKAAEEKLYEQTRKATLQKQRLKQGLIDQKRQLDAGRQELRILTERFQQQIAILQAELENSQEQNKMYSNAMEEITTITATLNRTPQPTVSY